MLCNLAKKRAFVNHYSFHILDPQWGHMTIKMSGHPPFGAQVILNGHEYVAAAARATGVRFVKEGNCFTRLADPTALAQIADTLSQPATIGRLTQVCDRWIYTACLCFGLDLAEQARSALVAAALTLQARVVPHVSPWTLIGQITHGRLVARPGAGPAGLRFRSSRVLARPHPDATVTTANRHARDRHAAA